MAEKEMLDGAISAFPTGHLMVVVSFNIKDDVEYIVVNDPLRIQTKRFASTIN